MLKSIRKQIARGYKKPVNIAMALGIHVFVVEHYIRVLKNMRWCERDILMNFMKEDEEDGQSPPVKTGGLKGDFQG